VIPSGSDEAARQDNATMHDEDVVALVSATKPTHIEHSASSAPRRVGLDLGKIDWISSRG
jgi:hypothetical protein